MHEMSQALATGLGTNAATALLPVEQRRKFIGTKRFGMGEKITSLTSKSHFLLPWASEPFLRWSPAAPARKGAFEQSGAAMKFSKTLSVLDR